MKSKDGTWTRVTPESKQKIVPIKTSITLPVQIPVGKIVLVMLLGLIIFSVIGRT